MIADADILAAAQGDRTAQVRLARALVAHLAGGDEQRRHALDAAERMAEAMIVPEARAEFARMLRVCAVGRVRAEALGDAIRLLDSALAIDPGNRDGRLMRASTNQHLGNGAGVAADLDVLLRADPLDRRALEFLAALADGAARDRLAAAAGRGIRERVAADPALGPAAVSAYLRLLDIDAARALLEPRKALLAQADDWLSAAREFASFAHDAALMRACIEALAARDPEGIAGHELRLELALETADLPALEEAHERVLRHPDKAKVDAQTLFAAAASRCRLDEAFADSWQAPRYKQVATVVPYLHPFGAPLGWLDGRRVLVIGYTAVGDEIRLIDLLDRARSRFASCTLAVDHRIVSLVARGRPDLEVMGVDRSASPAGAPAVPPVLHPHVDDAVWARRDEFDAALLLRQLEGTMVATPADLPATPRVLAADPQRRATWRSACESLGHRPKVGIFWRSNRSNYRRMSKVTQLDDWRDILAIEHLQFVNLQFGHGVEEELAAAAAGRAPVHRFASLDLRDDFEGVAALMSELDLVVAVPGTTHHLAGALGVPTLAITHPSQRLWRTRPGTTAGMWAPSIHVVSASAEEGFEGAIANAARLLRTWRPGAAWPDGPAGSD